MIKRRLTTSDIFLIAINLIPIWGVWFQQWEAAEVFLVYCLESVVIGLYNLIKMWLTTTIKKRDIWNDRTGNITMASGYFFMFFFFVHFGFFIVIQLYIFLTASGLEDKLGIAGVFDFLFHLPKYLNHNSLMLLLIFVVSYGLITIKDFVWTGEYKNASLSELLFQPYDRIFIQQFTVIAGSIFIGLGAGKIFISIFVLVKIFFDVFVSFRRYLRIATAKRRLIDK